MALRINFIYCCMIFGWHNSIFQLWEFFELELMAGSFIYFNAMNIEWILVILTTSCYIDNMYNQGRNLEDFWGQSIPSRRKFSSFSIILFEKTCFGDKGVPRKFLWEGERSKIFFLPHTHGCILVVIFNS